MRWPIMCAVLLVSVLGLDEPSRRSEGLGQTSLVDTSLKKRNGASRFCGQRLVDILHIVCMGRYRSKRIETEALHPQFNSIIEQIWRHPVSESESPFLDDMAAHTMLNKRHANRRWKRQPAIGAYDECCQKSCTLYELQGYCSPQPSSHHRRTILAQRQQLVEGSSGRQQLLETRPERQDSEID